MPSIPPWVYLLLTPPSSSLLAGYTLLGVTLLGSRRKKALGESLFLSFRTSRV